MGKEFRRALPRGSSLALRVDVDLDWYGFNRCAATLPERWLSSVSLDHARAYRLFARTLLAAVPPEPGFTRGGGEPLVPLNSCGKSSLK